MVQTDKPITILESSSLPKDLHVLLHEFSRNRSVGEMVSQFEKTIRSVTWEQWMKIGMTPGMFLETLSHYTPGDYPPLEFNGLPEPTKQEYKNMAIAYKWLSWCEGM